MVYLIIFTDDGFTYMIDTPETQGTVDFSGVDEYPDYKSQEYRPD